MANVGEEHGEGVSDLVNGSVVGIPVLVIDTVIDLVKGRVVGIGEYVRV